jgi:hypothetical protein
LCERPSANAFGIGAVTTAMRGLGMFACTQSRSITACNSGASATDTSMAPIAASAIRSDANSWIAKNTAAIAMTLAVSAPAAMATAISAA